MFCSKEDKKSVFKRGTGGSLKRSFSSDDSSDDSSEDEVKRLRVTDSKRPLSGPVELVASKRPCLDPSSSSSSSSLVPSSSEVEKESRLTERSIIPRPINLFTYIIGIDPGLRNLGVVFMNEQTLQANLYLIDLHKYYKLKGAEELRRSILYYLKDYQHIYRRCRVVAVEQQKISINKVKLMATEIGVQVKHYFPHVKCVEMDPLLTRRYWHITVKAKEHKNVEQKKLYNIRKALSADTNIVGTTDMPRLVAAFSKRPNKQGKSFYVDAIDAALLAVAYHFLEAEIDIANAKRMAKQYPPLDGVLCVSHKQQMPTVSNIVLNKFAGRERDGQLQSKKGVFAKTTTSQSKPKKTTQKESKKKKKKMSNEDSPDFPSAQEVELISPRKRSKSIFIEQSSTRKEESCSGSSSSDESESSSGEEGSVYSEKSEEESSSSEEEEEEEESSSEEESSEEDDDVEEDD